MYYKLIFFGSDYVKFVTKGDKHRDNDYIDEEYEHEETSQPRWIPSYYNIAKKEQKGKTPKV